MTTNDKYMFYGAELIGPIIKTKARIGANVTILPGVVIGEGAVVGSGSIVTKDIPAGTTVVGNPAGILKEKSVGSPTKIPKRQNWWEIRPEY